MSFRLAPYLGDIGLYLVAGLSGLYALGRGLVLGQGGNPPAVPAAPTLNSQTLAAILVTAITASTPLILRAVDVVRMREALRKYRHFAKGQEQKALFLEAENRRLRDLAVRMATAHRVDLPAWFWEVPPPPGSKDDLPIAPVIPDPGPPSDPGDRP